MAGNWPGVSYLINNGTLLFICMFTIGLPNAKSHYLVNCLKNYIIIKYIKY